MLRRSPKHLLWNESTDVQTCTFRVHVFRTARLNFYANLHDGVLHIACPGSTDFDSEQVQQLLQTLFEKALRYEAKRILLQRLQMLAERHSFHYTGVTVRNTQSRWGSCSSQKGISLSLSLMLLPEHLIDYVLLHELCHTVEMNHGERFWQLMDKVTDNRTQTLRRELKKHRMLPASQSPCEPRNKFGYTRNEFGCIRNKSGCTQNEFGYTRNESGCTRSEFGCTQNESGSPQK
jgi:predicted metal-dependent hydrolase